MRQRFGGLFLLRFVLLVYISVVMALKRSFSSYLDSSLALYSA
jgi:hypothetical protein